MYILSITLSFVAAVTNIHCGLADTSEGASDNKTKIINVNDTDAIYLNGATITSLSQKGGIQNIKLKDGTIINIENGKSVVDMAQAQDNDVMFSNVQKAEQHGENVMMTFKNGQSMIVSNAGFVTEQENGVYAATGVQINQQQNEVNNQTRNSQDTKKSTATTSKSKSSMSSKKSSKPDVNSALMPFNTSLLSTIAIGYMSFCF